MKNYYIYILASKKYGTLYIGVTSDLSRRIYEHKNKQVVGFTSKYSVDKLVYYEQTESVQAAIHREKQLKSRKRQWKLDLINSVNIHWNDLSEDIVS